jgi:predicted ATPase
MPARPSGTVTFLFTDVEGSTRLLHELGAERYAEALAEHRRAIREACAREGGVEVDTQGDAFFFAFPSASAALAAASAFTQALASGPIQVRVGLHTGTPLLTEEGYVGHDVHFAARVAASAHGGQVVLSAATADLVGAELLDLGEHRLKDVAEPVSIYQLADGSFPPLKTISNTNLPRPASSFVGRERELADVLARIERGARLLTLTGPGGSGKTRLALEAAAALVPEYKAGTFWVGLASLRDPALVTEMIAQTLGAKDGLAEHIGERALLLLLDNLEQVIEAAPEVASLLERCPNLTLLVTSRELLRVRGEVEYAVPPLAEREAVALFCERAQLQPTDEIAELCARLDSLPLAVELAAARTKALTPGQILERLSGRLDLLRGGRDTDPRQQTLRATIEWSHDLLSDAEQRLFRALAVFAGGCTLEAAEEVCDADLDSLQSLVEKSLLRFSDGRYWMLETIREYAHERLEQAGDAHELHVRHAEHYLALAEAAEPHLRTGGNQPVWLKRLEAEYENLRSALGWWLQAGAGNGLERFLVAIFRFWEIRPRFSEAAVWFDRAMARGYTGSRELEPDVLFAAGRLARWNNDLDTAAARLGRALTLFREREDDRAASACAGFLSNVLLAVGESERAEGLSRESVERARASEDDLTLANALHNRGVLLREKGDLNAAATCFQGGLATFRARGMSSGMANALVNLGILELARDDLSRAYEYLAEALEVSTSLGDSGWRTMTLRALSHHALLTDHASDALTLATDALALASRQDDEELILAALKDVAGACAASQDRTRGARLAAAADQLEERFSPFWSSDDRRIWARYTPTRQSLNSVEETREWDAGGMLSLEEAVAEGLSLRRSE